MVNEQEHQEINAQDSRVLFEELGARLRAFRQSKGLQLEDAARHIKLSERTLSSIEEGRQEDLPHTVYAKGFVRTYARFLGMPEDEIAQTLNDVFPAEEEEYSSPVVIIKQPRKNSPIGTIIILFLLAILAVGGWYVYSNVISRGGDEPPAAPSTPSDSSASVDSEAEARANLAAANLQPSSDFQTASPAEQPAAVGSPNQPAAFSSEPVAQATASSASVTQTGAAVEGGNTEVEGAVYFESGRGLTGDSGGQSQPASASGGAKKYRVVVTATEECWIKATTDSSDERPFNLPKNQSSVFTFDEFLKLRLGNAAGVKIRYNGRDFPIPSGQGNTRDLVFPPKDG